MVLWKSLDKGTLFYAYPQYPLTETYRLFFYYGAKVQLDNAKFRQTRIKSTYRFRFGDIIILVLLYSV